MMTKSTRMAARPWAFGQALRALAFAAALAPLVACDITYNLAHADLRAQAKEDWARSYTVGSGGRLEVANTNGTITIETTDGTTMEVKAERVVKGRDDAAAKDALQRVTIAEQQTGDFVRLATKIDRPAGLMNNLQAQVNYHVRAPRGIAVKLSNTNGAIEVSGVRGGADLETTNGAITGRELAGAVKAETVNGAVALTLAQLHEAGITAETVNGSVTIDLPRDARATITVRTMNGGIDVTGFELEDADKARRRLDGKVNGGGAPIAVETVNGGVTIGAR